MKYRNSDLIDALRYLVVQHGPTEVFLAAADMVEEPWTLVKDPTPVTAMAGPQPDPLENRTFHALDVWDIDALKKVLHSVTNLPEGLSGEVDYVNDRGDVIAQIWWHSEKEKWLVDYIGSAK